MKTQEKFSVGNLFLKEIPFLDEAVFEMENQSTFTRGSDNLPNVPEYRGMNFSIPVGSNRCFVVCLVSLLNSIFMVND